VRRALRVFTVLYACLFLAGCASFPFGSSKDYVKELYKRIPHKVEGEYKVVSIFYATDRKQADRDEGVYFGRELAERLTYGDLDVKINPRIKIGKMLPNRLKRKGILGIQDVRKLDDADFMSRLSEAVKNSPHNSLLVLIFGYQDNFEATAIKAAYFAYLLDVNTPVLLFDWPGDQPFTPGGYHKARLNANASGPYLGDLLAGIARDIKPAKMWVEASSLGCQVTCDAFDQMYKYPDMADEDTEIAHVILAAPDVAKEDFDDQFKKEIVALSDKVTAYVSSNDTALMISSILDNKEKLGRMKVKYDEDQLDEASAMLYLKSLQPEKYSVVDVTPINTASYKHGYYLEAPEFYDDFYLRIFDKEPHMNRNLYLVKYKGKVDLWVLQPNNK
jgi:esterase/lipase superfamily enzyme